MADHALLVKDIGNFLTDFVQIQRVAPELKWPCGFEHKHNFNFWFGTVFSWKGQGLTLNDAHIFVHVSSKKL